MKYFALSFLFLFTQTCEQFSSENQSRPVKDSYRIVSYNVENLFDTYDDEFKFDDDFTPYGSYYWGKKKYEKKLNDIGKVLVNLAEENIPAAIGLVEVENATVLEDLLNKSPLSKFQYGIVHEESPDERGIDVALLYDENQFQYISHQVGRIQFPKPIQDKTRDILFVKGILAKDTVFISVNHWPSRRGGASISEPKRKYVAKKLREKTEAILEKQPNAGVIIMGDFNDTPTNKSLYQSLGAKPFDDENSQLVNLMYPFEKQGVGTYKFRNQWNLLDQFIVSRNLMDSIGSLRITQNSAKIFDADWLKEDDPVYPGERLYRTYLGPKYKGGYSDHFPIYLDIEVQKN